MKGLGSLLVWATKRLMVAWRSTTHRKTPRFSRCLASLAKNPSTALSHEHEVGVKWKAKRRAPVEPLTHLWMFVDGVVVEDHVHRLSDRHLRLNGIEEANELLVAMALHTSANDFAFEHVESSEQRRCSMALVVVGHRAGAAFLHRQAGLGAVEGLDLRFLIDREHDGMGGRIDIEPDNIAQLVDKLRVGGELELLDPVRLETMLRARCVARNLR